MESQWFYKLFGKICLVPYILITFLCTYPENDLQEQHVLLKTRLPQKCYFPFLERNSFGYSANIPNVTCKVKA